MCTLGDISKKRTTPQNLRDTDKDSDINWQLKMFEFQINMVGDR